MGTKINIWMDNMELLKSLCDKEGIGCDFQLAAKDCDGDYLYTAYMDRPLSRESQLEYQEKRTRKEWM